MKDGKIEAIIDWESAGYYPWWAERVVCGHHHPRKLDGPLWAKGWPDMDGEVFKQVFEGFWAVHTAYDLASTKHPNSPYYMRPPFCECKPYADFIGSLTKPSKTEHEFGDFGDFEKYTTDWLRIFAGRQVRAVVLWHLLCFAFLKRYLDSCLGSLFIKYRLAPAISTSPEEISWYSGDLQDGLIYCQSKKAHLLWFHLLCTFQYQ